MEHESRWNTLRSPRKVAKAGFSGQEKVRICTTQFWRLQETPIQKMKMFRFPISTCWVNRFPQSEEASTSLRWISGPTLSADY